MGEDGFLDYAYNAQPVSSFQMKSHGTTSFLPSFILCAMLLLTGCASFPRVIVLEDPLTPIEHLNLGVAYEKSGELDSAIKEYELAAEKTHVAYLYLGNAYFQKSELDKAEKYYKLAIKKDTRNADVCNNLAWLYYTKGENLDEAEKLVLKAIDLNPSKSDIYTDTLEKIRERKSHVRYR